jgi:hypothetical protein
MVDMATTSVKRRFEELQSFKTILRILMSSTSLKALDGSQPVAELEPKFRCGGMNRDYIKLSNLYTMHVCTIKNI